MPYFSSWKWQVWARPFGGYLCLSSPNSIRPKTDCVVYPTRTLFIWQLIPRHQDTAGLGVKELSSISYFKVCGCKVSCGLTHGTGPLLEWLRCTPLPIDRLDYFKPVGSSSRDCRFSSSANKTANSSNKALYLANSSANNNHAAETPTELSSEVGSLSQTDQDGVIPVKEIIDGIQALLLERRQDSERLEKLATRIETQATENTALLGGKLDKVLERSIEPGILEGLMELSAVKSFKKWTKDKIKPDLEALFPDKTKNIAISDGALFKLVEKHLQQDEVAYITSSSACHDAMVRVLRNRISRWNEYRRRTRRSPPKRPRVDLLPPTNAAAIVRPTHPAVSPSPALPRNQPTHTASNSYTLQQRLRSSTTQPMAQHPHLRSQTTNTTAPAKGL
ncbi:hypothetical protein Pelo_16571 [Pelomyxa schiedti]|nr:hypothetical protein Pelo_16571 [Pelomyxa schiedti]